jgi:phage tail sheath protein FI
MPITPTYPGVYIEEIPSGVRTITGVATSITAFIGRAIRGPLDSPIRIQSFGDFERVFGGLAVDSCMSYAVQQFFSNGGTDAIVVRVAHVEAIEGKSASSAIIEVDGLTLQAGFLGDDNPGVWGNNLAAVVDYETKDKGRLDLFNLTIAELQPDPINKDATIPVLMEVFRNVSYKKDDSRYVETILQQQSLLVRAKGVSAKRPKEVKPATPPKTTAEPNPVPGPLFVKSAEYFPVTKKGSDGEQVTRDDLTGQGKEKAKAGLFALEDADLFNLLCIPPLDRSQNELPFEVYQSALVYCRTRRAMLMVDPPSSWKEVSSAEAGFSDLAGKLGENSINAAMFFPRIIASDALKENRLEEFVPCGALAGLFAKTDAQRGVWKAPAGIDATLTGVSELTVKMTDAQNGRLNPIGLNCLRTFPLVGNVSWGSRTMRGADRLSSEWKYIPVRRMALFLEESLYRGLQFAVFEPNDEPLWAQIRLNVGAFMQNLFRQGAFQGRTPNDAYRVKCDDETTIQNDIDRGIVNVLVQFAPLKPAEFVMVKIQQLAGQIQT